MGNGKGKQAQRERSKHTALSKSIGPSQALIRFIDKWPDFHNNREDVHGLDFGAGHGRHATALRDKGYVVYAYDPFNGSPTADPYTEVSSKLPKSKDFDLVFSAFVLNVMTKEDMLKTLREMESFAPEGFVVHIVREDADIKRVGPGESFTGRGGSIQRRIPIDELKDLGYHRMENKFFVKDHLDGTF